MPAPTRHDFLDLVERSRTGPPTNETRTLCVPIVVRLLSDQLTPVLAYRRLVADDERTAPSFLLESVENGERQGRYSMLGAQPALELTAKGHRVHIINHRAATSGGAGVEETDLDNPLTKLREIAAGFRLVVPDDLALPLLGGWVGYAGYDTVRYAEPGKLDPANAPPDDRDLPDLQFGLYDSVVVFDHAQKLVNVVQLAMVAPGDDAAACYDEAIHRLDGRIAQIERHSKPLASGRLGVDGRAGRQRKPMPSNVTRAQHTAMVERVLEYIRAGDVFQCVVGQRFERVSRADPFDVYRALRAVNPSPYMVYMQGRGCMLVASSPEILCRVHYDEGGNGVVTNRPLAGTRMRGATPEEDAALEADLLGDQKERAEHAMLVDLGRNDVGRVAIPGSIKLDKVMQIERYSHVMHISSTVTGVLRDGKDCWDALRATLPVGTISGAPKIRAMQIIDELEPVRRGPYGGGMGYVGLDGQMDIALTLRTIVVPTALRDGAHWTYHIQAAGGIVADSKPGPEFQETVNKAAALARAIDAAEAAFGGEEATERRSDGATKGGEETERRRDEETK
jgi:anthranilate synthase component I